MAGRASGGAQLRLIVLLGIMQILTYGSTNYLLTVLAPAIVADTGWPLALVIGGFSLAVLVSGFVAPAVGRRIERFGGRAVLPAGCLVLAAGLALLGAAGTLWLYAAGWIVIGLAMAATLYEAAFAALGRQFGLRARRLITLLTLFGGFSSTLCWPFSALLVEWLGWRGACFVYAGLQLALVLPLRLALAPPPAHEALAPAAAVGAGPPSRSVRRRALLIAFGIWLSIAATLTAVVSVHLLALLGARQVALAGAVAFGALIGPSQVGARVLELLFGRRAHPLWSLAAGALATALGLSLLWLSHAWIGLALVFYGAGVGLRSIAAGAVPLALVGPRGYATVMGRLAAPSLVLQALAPVAAAQLLDAHAGGAELLLAILAAAALVNLALAIALLLAGRRTTA